MLTYDEIKKYCSDYKIENGIVIEKKSNKPITNEDIILKVKSSILIFREAHSDYKNDLNQFGKTNKSQDDYIKKTMEKFSVNGEVSTYGINKVVNALLNSNGHYEEMISGSDLQSGKFSMLVPPKQDYGLAYLKLKFREKGLDIDGFKISQDLTELKHNGVSKVIIDFNIKKYEKVESNIKDQNLESANRYTHPMSQRLNELEGIKQNAKANNDIEAYQKAQTEIEQIIRQNPVTISGEKWDNMNIDQRIFYMQVKMNEARVLHDEDGYNYWKANLSNLQNKKQEDQLTNENSETSLTNDNNSSNKKEFVDYYQQLMLAVNKRRTAANLTEDEKKQIVGEIYYNMGYIVQNIKTDREVMDLLSKLVVDLNNDDFERKIQHQIIAEIQEKYNKKKKNNEKIDNKEPVTKTEKSDLSRNIEQLKSKLKRLQIEYHDMLSDGYIDDNELEVLIRKMRELSNDADGLIRFATTSNERHILNSIIDTIEEEKRKMIKTQNNVEEISRGSR